MDDGRSTYEFKGFSWEELLECWGLNPPQQGLPEFDGDEPDRGSLDKYPVPGGYSWSQWWDNEVSQAYKDHIDELGRIGDADEAARLNAVREHLTASTAYAGAEPGPNPVVSDLKRFIARLRDQSEGLDYHTPVWSALLQVEDDHTLIRLVDALLPLMWS